MFLLFTGILIVLVFFGAQLKVRTAFAVPRLTSQNPVALGANTCASGSCHSGTPAPGGSVVVNFPSGLTYSPGTVQHLSVTVTDPNQTRVGFELTARLAKINMLHPDTGDIHGLAASQTGAANAS